MYHQNQRQEIFPLYRNNQLNKSHPFSKFHSNFPQKNHKTKKKRVLFPHILAFPRRTTRNFLEFPKNRSPILIPPLFPLPKHPKRHKYLCNNAPLRPPNLPPLNPPLLHIQHFQNPHLPLQNLHLPIPKRNKIKLKIPFFSEN